MKIWFVYVLFNVITGGLSPEMVVEKTFDNWSDCAMAINHSGPQKPDKNHNVKLYQCISADGKTSAIYTQR